MPFEALLKQREGRFWFKDIGGKILLFSRHTLSVLFSLSVAIEGNCSTTRLILDFVNSDIIVLSAAIIYCTRTLIIV